MDCEDRDVYRGASSPQNCIVIMRLHRRRRLVELIPSFKFSGPCLSDNMNSCNTSIEVQYMQNYISITGLKVPQLSEMMKSMSYTEMLEQDVTMTMKNVATKNYQYLEVEPSGFLLV